MCKINVREYRRDNKKIDKGIGVTVTLNSVRPEIVSALTIDSYDKVRGRNKAQRLLRSVCVRFFIANITQPDTISQDTIMSYITSVSTIFQLDF